MNNEHNSYDFTVYGCFLLSSKEAHHGTNAG